ncbi:undecaprenyl-phosphate glucose phosphotransferase [Dysgonomonas sp. 520]|uniref:undecaprenyl-phosphate glucose phosphotransferase n=1 Tax=Dysgonomonas sp. 520 TaxID=2302931 RepID=UPI0013D32F6F|nr:undecaprenyl-phosphate glucose phosphotransferase [Dysgonomonas sp. 520]NDW08160.1 undecaprenyl-phosphate glucose phosphotransferase [Dysgonomonas sp. 520]
MGITNKKGGYGFLIGWIVMLGDLLCINLFFLVLFKYYGYIFFYDKHSLIEFFLLINLSYYVTKHIIPANISSNIVFFDKIVQRAVSFISVLMLIFITGVTLFGVVSPKWYEWAICYLALCFFYSLWHVIFRIVLKSYRQSGHNYKRVVIVGGGLNGLDIMHEFASSVYGYKVCGLFDDNEELKKTQPLYVGKISKVEQFCIDNEIDEIYCTLPGNQEPKILKLLNFSEKNMIRFYLVPEFYKYIKRKLVLNFLRSTPIIEIRTEPLQSFSNRLLKRAFDIVFSLIVLVTVFPLVYLICGLLIKLESPGPILFKQQRTGLHGKIFTCYKFRSMKLNKEANLLTTVKTDPRITRIGNFMRKTSIDELPQFINVLVGDMSVVGPRPHMIKQTEIYNKLIDTFMIRHLIKPGVTGWAQISGYRGEIKTVEQMEGRFKHDVWYLENWSFILDLKIIFVTAFKVVFGDEDAY